MTVTVTTVRELPGERPLDDLGQRRMDVDGFTDIPDGPGTRFHRDDDLLDECRGQHR